VSKILKVSLKRNYLFDFCRLVVVEIWHITVCSYKKLAIFTTNVDAENKCLINHKTVCGALNRQFLVGAVLVAQLYISIVSNSVDYSQS
jgi:hypothetical protein